MSIIYLIHKAARCLPLHATWSGFRHRQVHTSNDLSFWCTILLNLVMKINPQILSPTV